MPIVRVSQAIKRLCRGDVVVVEARDIAFPADIRAWARVSGNAVEAVETGSDGTFTARLRKS
jgi:TusA-related sulfurtransferase